MSPRRVLNKLPQLAALLLLTATACQGRSDGAPDGACETMVPSHGHKPNEESTFPYQLQVSTKQVHPGGRVTLTIRSTDLDTPDIKGFFVQARHAENSADSPALGQFVQIDSLYRTVNCSGGVATGVTHRTRANKQRVAVTWQAPADLDADVVFLASVVQEYDAFWAAIHSDTIALADGTEPEPEPEVTAEPEPEPETEPEPEPEAEADAEPHGDHDDHSHDHEGDDDGNSAMSMRAGIALVMAPLAIAAVHRLH